MSEETQEQEGTWSGLKKAIIGTVSTIILGAGTWAGTTLFGGGEEKAESAPVQQASPVINLNVQNSNTQQRSAGGTKVIERVVEKPAAQPAPASKKKEFNEEPKW